MKKNAFFSLILQFVVLLFCSSGAFECSADTVFTREGQTMCGVINAGDGI